MILIILILLILMVVWLIGRQRKKKRTTSSNSTPIPEPTETVPTETADPDPPTFKIVALGLSGAGKTILLSSMFHSLNFRDHHRSYFLETIPENRLKLNKIYSTLSDTSQPWPRGTRVAETSEYLFDCVAFDERDVKHNVLRINYLDYAGELLETEQESGSNALRNLDEHIHSAQALLCVIDGHRVLQLLKNEPAGRNHFQFTMQTMIGMMQGANCPIQLVISKWDIVRGFGEPADADEQFRLGRVIDALMTFDHIRSLVYERGTHQVTRIIPVSAVGSNFAQIDSKGIMTKRHGGQIRPSNVDVPLCSVVPDAFKQVESSLDNKTRSALDSELQKKTNIRPVEVLSGLAAFVKRPAGIVVRTALLGTLGGDIGGEVTSMFFDWAAQPYENKVSKIEEERRTGEFQIERFQRARSSVLEDFTKAVLRLEAIYPNSQLARK